MKAVERLSRPRAEHNATTTGAPTAEWEELSKRLAHPFPALYVTDARQVGPRV